MNSHQAKQIPLQNILAKLGHSPVREVRGEFWYNSPFRDESAPSFKIKVQDNVWYDFGEGKGGNVLDFVMRYYRTESISDALRKLESLAPAGGLEFAATARETLPVAFKRARKQVEEPAIELRKVRPLENRALTGYLKRRGVSVEIARLYVQEIYYRYGEKDYFALAFPNQSGGYELRNPYFKGTYGTKDITLLHHEPNSQADAVTVFEGFMDYLSALTYYGKQEADTPVIVLNSVAMRDKAAKTILTMEAATVHFYLDLDFSGREAMEYIQDQLPKVDVIDHSALYTGYKDMSEWLEITGGASHGKG
jgi:DNA primase